MLSTLLFKSPKQDANKTCKIEIRNYPEEKETEQELEVDGDSKSVSPTPLYTGIRDLFPKAIEIFFYVYQFNFPIGVILKFMYILSKIN